MAVPENVGRDLPSGELLLARDLLDPGLFCQAVLNAVLVLRCPELWPGKSHTWPRPAARNQAGAGCESWPGLGLQLCYSLNI